MAVLVLLIGASPESAPPTSLPETVVECVPCHRSGEMDQVGEWLASPYSASEGGLGCIDCHQAQCSGTRSDEPVDRATAVEYLEELRRALRLSLTAICNNEVVEAEVAVTNAGAGHNVPTGPIERSLVLDVVARGHNAEPLPPFTNSGAPGSSPRDIRLAPFATDVRHYLFTAPGEGLVQVTARLLLVKRKGNAVELANTTTVCSSSNRSQ